MKYVTEHIIELSTFRRALEWMMSGTATIHDSRVVTSRYAPVPESLLLSGVGGYFQTPWNQWAPGSSSTSTPMDDIWTAFGDTRNPHVLVNCESVFNNVKMQIWQGKNPMSNDTWDSKDFDDTTERTGFDAAQGGMSAIRMATSIFTYLNDRVINTNMATVLNSIHDTFEQFDREVGSATGTTIDTSGMFSEYVYFVMIPRIEAVQAWAENRIRAMIDNWELVRSQPSSSRHGGDAEQVIDTLENMLELVEAAILIDTSRFRFFPPSPKMA